VTSKGNREMWLVLGSFVLAVVSSSAVGNIYYVDLDGGAGAFTSIQAAIDAADTDDEIIVRPGTYLEAINFNGKAIRLASSDGPEATTIDGTGHCHVVQCVSGEGPSTVLKGFTITGGKADKLAYLGDRGAGMLNVGSSPTVTNCIFSGNMTREGGGMYNEDSSLTITNCTFTSNGTPVNSSSSRGAGMLNLNSSIKVTNCTFRRNSARSGGAMYNYRSSLTVTNCSFSRNTATGFGGAICNVVDSRLTVVNCSFSDNEVMRAGGILKRNDTGGGGGIFSDIRSSAKVANCILWGGKPNELACPGGVTTVTVNWSNVQGGWDGPGGNNIAVDPLFVDSRKGDLRLKPESPCINVADDASAQASTDLGGSPRIMKGVDMGAFEAQWPGHVVGRNYVTDAYR